MHPVDLKREHCDVRCDRKSIWGNPFPMQHHSDAERDRVIRAYKRWLWTEITERDGAQRLLEPLIYKQRQQDDSLKMGCHCAPKPCHCNVLIDACEWYEANFQKVRCLTLRRPWAWAVAHAGKDVENRDWQCPLPPGTIVAIHAGQKFEADGAEWIEREMGIAVPPKDQHPTGIVAIATVGECTPFAAAVSPWQNGSDFCWELRNVRALKRPIPQRGQQGVFTLSEEVSGVVFRQLLEASAIGQFDEKFEQQELTV